MLLGGYSGFGDWRVALLLVSLQLRVPKDAKRELFVGVRMSATVAAVVMVVTVLLKVVMTP